MFYSFVFFRISLISTYKDKITQVFCFCLLELAFLCIQFEVSFNLDYIIEENLTFLPNEAICETLFIRPSTVAGSYTNENAINCQSLVLAEIAVSFLSSGLFSMVTTF